MAPVFEPEIWKAQFASALMRIQPRFPPRLAREFAQQIQPHLGLVGPIVAVRTVLDWAIEYQQQEGDNADSAP